MDMNKQMVAEYVNDHLLSHARSNSLPPHSFPPFSKKTIYIELILI